MSDTKWSLLQRQLANLNADAAKLAAELEWMKRTPFGQPCSGCGAALATEADFAKHFVVTDLRLLNIGHCPNTRS